MSGAKIHSSRVLLLEGNADEFVPNAKLAKGMHGFVIMVPAEEGDNWLLDMVWRITMAYAAMPSLFYSRAKVRTMVEAVMARKKKRAIDKPKPKASGLRKAKVAPASEPTGTRIKSGFAGPPVRPRKRR